MRPEILTGPPPATLAVLLDDPQAHDFPAASMILGGLIGEQAVTVPAGLPYSVAAIVAHMNANMAFNLGLMRKADPVATVVGVDLWPPVAAHQWPALVEEFADLVSSLTRIAHDETNLARVLHPATAKEPAWTVGYKLAASVAKHNAYHLGQIVVLRRLLGAWREGPARI